MDGKEIDIQEILGILLARIKLIIVVTILAGAAGYSYAKFVLPQQYTASIKIIVTNVTNGFSDDAELSGHNQATARSLASTYIVILDDTSVYEAISDELIAHYDEDDLKNYFTVLMDDSGREYIPPSQIRRLISFSEVNNTEVLQVTVTSEVPSFSAAICNYISELAPDIIKRTMKVGAVETVSPAQEPSAPSGPNIMRYLMMGLMAGFAASVGVVLLISFFDNTIKSGEDIKARFDVPVLAEIPDIFIDERGGSGKYGK